MTAPLALATADEVCRFLADDVPRLLASELATVLPRGTGPVRARVTRAKLKPGRKLTVSADVTGDGIRHPPATATWEAEEGMRVLVAPADPGFPRLPDLYDPTRLADVLEDAVPGRFGPDLTVTPLRYRPGQRHVLLVESADGRDRLYAKCSRDDAGRRAVAVRGVVADALSRGDGSARVARGAGYVASHRVALWDGHPGRVMSELVSGPPTGAVPVARLAGAAIRSVHDVRDPLPEPGRDGRDGRDGRTDPAAEAASTRRALEHVVALAPSLAARVEWLLDTTLADLLSGPDERGHLVHGDLKCDNVLVDRGRLCLLDLDRVTTGDPALDLGKLTADLRWWARGGGTAAEVLVGAVLEGYGRCPPARLRRAHLYDVLFQLRAVGRRVPLHEPGWADAVEAAVSSAESTHRSPR
ncbi:hypothetical protein GCM10023168_30920 [Fodinibacter luteus]|uniref:Aminoglycoside phosphotransferase domain-containing protein n=1 Tax=Fodinibacter luteus TaxID=552064 RepID=A0ABP8KNB3_9MICO